MSQYSYLFPDAPSGLVLLSCKPFETPVSLTGHAAFDADFSESVSHARLGIDRLSSARRAALSQNSPWFYAGSNLLSYFRLSLACYDDGQAALSESIASVKSSFLVFDQAERDLRELGTDPIIEEHLEQLDANSEGIENLDGRRSKLAEKFLGALNATRAAFVSPVLLRHAVGTLLSSNGLLEAVILKTRKLQSAKKEALRSLEEIRLLAQERQRQAARLQDRLTEERLYLVPESAFSLQKTQFADSSLSFRFPEKWDRANVLLEESLLILNGAQKDLKAVSRFGQAMSAIRKSLSLAEESKSLFDSAQRETLSLEKALTLELSSRYARASISEKKLMDEPLPRALGPRIVQLANRMNALGAKNLDDAEKTNLNRLAGLLKDQKVDVSHESASLSSLQNHEALSDIRNSLDEKYEKLISKLKSAYADLRPFSAIIPLPPADLYIGKFLDDPDALGRWERELEDAKNSAEKKAPEAVRISLSSSFSIGISYPPVRLDEPMEVEFDLEYENPLGFGAQNVLVDQPDELKGAILFDAPSGIRQTEKGLFFSSIFPGQRGVLHFRKNQLLARKTSSKDVELYSDFNEVRRKTTVVFFSEVAAEVIFEEKIPAEPSEIIATHPVWYDGVLNVRVLARPGANTFVAEYALPNPVEVRTVPLNGSLLFVLKNKFPFSLEAFHGSRIESFACPPNASFVTPLGGQTYQVDFKAAFLSREEKSFIAPLSCPAAIIPEGPAAVSPIPISLVQARRWANAYPESSEWLRLAEDAFFHNQQNSLEEALKKIQEVEKRTAKSMEARADALCGRCSNAVRDPVMRAKSAIFIRDFKEAERYLSEGESVRDSENLELLQKAEQVALAEKKAAETFAPELEQFLTASSGGRIPALVPFSDIFDSAKKRLVRIQSGKVAPDKIDGELRILSEEREKLAQGLEGARKSAKEALEAARLAQKQFGNFSTSTRLSAAESDFADGRLSSSQLSAERLVRTLQESPVSKTTGLVPAAFQDWILGVVSLLALGGLVYYFHLKKPPEPVGEI